MILSGTACSLDGERIVQYAGQYWTVQPYGVGAKDLPSFGHALANYPI